MFCSKCGKTLKPETEACPFCGTPVGDSRFEGNGYTAAQPRFVSGATDEVRESTPYTRTTYTSDEGAEQQGDVYSRTTYRPILKAEEKQAQAESITPLDEAQPDADEAPAHAAAPEGLKAAQPVMHVSNLAEDESLIDSSIVIAPLKPIKKTGISPEVQQYIRRMNDQKSQKRPGKAQFLGGTSDADTELPGNEELDKLAVEAQSDMTGALTDVEDAAGANELAAPRRARSERKPMPGWLKPAAIIVCIAIILTVAAYALITQFADSSKLEGVGYDLRAKGIELIKTRVTDASRMEMIKLVQADPTNKLFFDRVAESHEQIAQLMPEQPMKNDELFINALDSIQLTVDNANMIDALARLSGDPSLTGLGEESAKAWKDILNSIDRLETVKEKIELEGIIKGTVESLTTPEPTPEPEGPRYKTLKRGMNNNKDVRKLQIRLQQLGWFNSNVDSDYGTVTAIAVKKFQEAAGFDANGIADSPTLEAIYADDAPRSSKKTTPKPETAPTLSAGEPEQPAVTDPPAGADQTEEELNPDGI